MNKVILIGYMAVGKSTVAGVLSSKTGINYVELDELIEKKCNLNIDQIFKSKGEIYFRKIEHEIFTQLVENEQRLIISTGGGTPCYADNHLRLNFKNTLSIYLKASLPILVERLKLEKNKRPLVASLANEELMEFVAKQLFERSYFYNQATYVLDTDNKNADMISQEIIELLN